MLLGLFVFSSLVYGEQKILYKSFQYETFEAVKNYYTADPMIAVAGCAAGIMNNSFYAFGGETQYGATNELFAFEFPAKSWIRVYYPAADRKLETDML